MSIINEAEQKEDTTIQFGDAMSDGRLTESNNRVFDVRKAIAYKRQLGRLLTDEEMKMFEIVSLRK